jgi:hypothetical protein
MEWYRNLTRKQKASIREVFELACGMNLNFAVRLLSFETCMDVLHNKLIMEGIIER